jgi:hypothetical protein
MRVLRKINDQLDIIKYPRHDMKPVIGLADNIEFYIIKENIPVYDNLIQYISFDNYELTNNYDLTYPHLKIALKNYIINDIPVEIDRIKNIEDAVKLFAKNAKDYIKEDKDKLTEIINKIK